MFDIGFTELLLVGLVALLVFGPERLPEVVRTVSSWSSRIRRWLSTIRSEMEREIGADEIRRQLHNERILELEREMQAMQQSLREPLNRSGSTPPAAPAETPTDSQDKTPSP